MAVLHKTRNGGLPSTQLGNFPVGARVIPGCKMAASTVYSNLINIWDKYFDIVYSASPFCTQGTHMSSSGSFVTMYLAELHFGNGYMENGLLISNLQGIVYWASPFCIQGTHMPSSGSFVTMYLAKLHFGNGYMDIGLLIGTVRAAPCILPPNA